MMSLWLWLQIAAVIASVCLIRGQPLVAIYLMLVALWFQGDPLWRKHV